MTPHPRRVGLFFGYAPPELGAPVMRALSLARYLSAEGEYEPVFFAPARAEVSADTGEFQQVRFESRAHLSDLIDSANLSVAVVSSPPLDVAHWAARALRDAGVVPTLVDFRDPALQAALYHYGWGPRNWSRLAKSWIKEGHLMSYAFASTAVSDHLSRLLWRQHPLAGRGIQIAPNGADVEIFSVQGDASRRAVRAELGIPQDAPVIVYLGSVAPEYEVSHFLKTCGQAIGQAGAYVLLIAIYASRDAHRVEDIRSAATEAGVRERLTVLGNIAPEAVPRYLNAADIGLTAVGRGLDYAIQVKLYEYLQCGIPVLSKAGPRSALAGFFQANPGLGWWFRSWQEVSTAVPNLCKAAPGMRSGIISEKNAERFSRRTANECFAQLMGATGRVQRTGITERMVG